MGAITRIDLRFSVVSILLVVANYYGTGESVSIFGYDLHWFLYYLIVSFVVEGLILLAYRKFVGLSFEK